VLVVVLAVGICSVAGLLMWWAARRAEHVSLRLSHRMMERTPTNQLTSDLTEFTDELRRIVDERADR